MSHWSSCESLQKISLCKGDNKARKLLNKEIAMKNDNISEEDIKDTEEEFENDLRSDEDHIGSAQRLAEEADKQFTEGIRCLGTAALNEDAPLHRYSKLSEDGVSHLEKAIKLGLPLMDEATALAFLGNEYLTLAVEYGENEQLEFGPLTSKGIDVLERALVLDTENNGDFLDDLVKKMFMPSLSIAYGLESTTLSNDDAIPFLQEKLKRCDTPVLHLLLGNCYGIKHMLIQALLSWENAIKANKFGVEKFADSIEKARNNIEMIKSDDVLVDEIKRKISEFESEIRRLDTERNKKFDEAGKIAYKEYLKNKPDHPPAVVTKWNELEDIDSRISRNKQDLSGLKQREKKTGFLAKLEDSITSTAKSGKLKFDVHNLERKKDGVITEFGRVLYNSHKNGDNTLEELSSIWQNIDDMEQQISKNEEEIAKLRKYL
jgi:uncharacterized small protein (DUF1192 family)